MAIGGAIGAGLGVVIGVWACEQGGDPDDGCTGTAMGAGLGGAVMVGFLGMMIGAQFPKDDGEEPASPDTSTVNESEDQFGLPGAWSLSSHRAHPGRFHQRGFGIGSYNSVARAL